MNLARVIAVTLLSLFSSVESAEAGHQLLQGRKLVLKDQRPGGDPAGRQWSVQVKEAASAATLSGDPTSNGATISVFTDGTASGSQTYALPQGTNSKGKPLWKETASGFSYSDPDGINGPVRRLKITRSSKGKFQLLANASGKTGAIDVLPPNAVARGCVRLDLGGGDSYHVLFGADASIGKNDAKLFVSEKPASTGLCCDLGSAPPCCPATCPGDVCRLEGSCDPIDGLCQNQPRANGSTCDAGLDNLEPMTCEGGICATCTPAGTCVCSADTHCPTGQTCTSGVCQCTADTQCASGQTCNSGSCTCADDTHCAQGQTCTNGLCAAPVRACAFDLQCPAGQCSITSSPTPRFVDNADGTVTDRQTCLVWEKKDAYDGIGAECPNSEGTLAASCANPHDADNLYTAGSAGSAQTSFLTELNDTSFAGHDTWRLPGEELRSLVDLSAPGCGSGGPCIASAFDNNCVPTCSGTDPTCSCTAPYGYWFGRSTSLIDFADGGTKTGTAEIGQAVRAVRGCVALTTTLVLPSVKAQCFNACAVSCRNDGQCIFGCMVGQDYSAERCVADCDGFAPVCLQSCQQTLDCIAINSGACTPP